MSDALVNHPHVGSLWLFDAKIQDTPKGSYVVGEVFSDYTILGHHVSEGLMNFPASCVRRWEPPLPQEPHTPKGAEA